MGAGMVVHALVAGVPEEASKGDHNNDRDVSIEAVKTVHDCMPTFAVYVYAHLRGLKLRYPTTILTRWYMCARALGLLMPSVTALCSLSKAQCE